MSMKATISTKVDWSVTITLSAVELCLVSDVLNDAISATYSDNFAANLRRVRDELSEIRAAAINMASDTAVSSKALFNGSTNPEVLDALREYKIVTAIKTYRAANPGMGLREAKDAVEAIRDAMYEAGTLDRPPPTVW